MSSLNETLSKEALWMLSIVFMPLTKSLFPSVDIVWLVGSLTVAPAMTTRVTSGHLSVTCGFLDCNASYEYDYKSDMWSL